MHIFIIFFWYFIQDNNNVVQTLWPPTKASIVFDNLKVFPNAPLLFVQKKNYPAFESYLFRNVTKNTIVLHQIYFILYRFKNKTVLYDYKLENYLLTKNAIIRLIIIYNKQMMPDEFKLDYSKDVIFYAKDIFNNISQNQIGIKIVDQKQFGFELFSDEQNAISIRDNWSVNDTIQICSGIQSKWFIGCIKKIFRDDKGDWLEIEFDNDKTATFQRYSQYIRPLTDATPSY